jgi:hypothetical protein
LETDYRVDQIFYTLKNDHNFFQINPCSIILFYFHPGTIGNWFMSKIAKISHFFCLVPFTLSDLENFLQIRFFCTRGFFNMGNTNSKEFFYDHEKGSNRPTWKLTDSTLSFGPNKKFYDSYSPCWKTSWYKKSADLENFVKIRFFYPRGDQAKKFFLWFLDMIRLIIVSGWK